MPTRKQNVESTLFVFAANKLMRKVMAQSRRSIAKLNLHAIIHGGLFCNAHQSRSAINVSFMQTSLESDTAAQWRFDMHAHTN